MTVKELGYVVHVVAAVVIVVIIIIWFLGTLVQAFSDQLRMSKGWICKAGSQRALLLVNVFLIFW